MEGSAARTVRGSGEGGRVRCLHLITGLTVGGAENMLRRLILQTQGRELEHEVISLTGAGPMGEMLLDDGIPVSVLGMSPSRPVSGELVRLASRVRRSRVDVLQGWMYHANLLAGIVGRWSRVPGIAWNIRASTLGALGGRRGSAMVARIGGRAASRLSDAVVTNSHAARESHVMLGYPAGRFRVIPNGFDLGVFRPDGAARAEIRAELGIPGSAAVIGIVGRYHAVKDYPMFVRAAAHLHAGGRNVHFVLAGREVTGENDALGAMIREAGMTRSMHLLGERRDMPRVFAAMDLCTNCSTSEAFPNVVAEAMACGVPCVVTPVGDSVQIVGDTGLLVQVGDARALAGAWEELLQSGPEALRARGEHARARIAEHYSIAAIAEHYVRLYQELAEGRRAGRAG